MSKLADELRSKILEAIKGFEPVGRLDGTPDKKVIPIGYDLIKDERTEYGFYWEYEDMEKCTDKILTILSQTLNDCGERWKAMVDFEEHYQISSIGRVKSFKTDKILKLKRSNKGYRVFTPSVNGTSKMYYVHRAVAKAFIDNPEDKPFVNHIDNDPAHNCVANLEWCTQTENVAHMREQGRNNYTGGPKKLKSHCSKGHEYTPENTMIITNPDGSTSRNCRVCRRAQVAKYRANHKANLINKLGLK